MDSNTPYDAIAAESAKFNSIDPYLTAVYNSDFGLNQCWWAFKYAQCLQ
jgi:vitamin B12 transporter